MGMRRGWFSFCMHEGHMIQRNEFEVLSYIEDKKSCTSDARTMADALLLSCAIVEETLRSLLEKKLISARNGSLSLTESGREVLAPYRVKRAVILAAGFGSRMMPATADRPKPMVTVNGKRIIETLLDALLASGITDITLVRGYHKEAFDALKETYPTLRFIDNDDYDKTNNISSALLALEHFKGGAYLCEADLYISNPKIIKKYQYTSNLLGSYSLATDDWSYKMDDDGCIGTYKKGNRFCWNYYGISYWTGEDCEKLAADWKEAFAKDKDMFWEQVPLQLKKERYHVEIRPCRKSDIIEIDNYYELAILDPSYRDRLPEDKETL